VIRIIPLAALLFLPSAANETKKDDPPALKLSDDEQAFLDMTNAERAKEELPALTANPTLFAVARAHSANMAKQGKMEHTLDGKACKDRVDGAGYDYRRVGENIAKAEGASPADIMKGWMNSKLHRENILESKFTEIGLGVAVNDKGEAYYTQVLGTPRMK
jgi:uncharacterized protein YkwD